MAQNKRITREREIDALSAEAKKTGKRIELPVKGHTGLRVCAHPTGAVSFILTRRILGTGKTARHKLGERPVLSLALAKEKFSDELRRLMARTGKRAKTSRGKMPIFADLAEERFARGSALATETLKEYRRCLGADVYPLIGNIAIDRIEPEDIIDICQALADRGSTIAANRVKRTISTVFKYGVDMLYISRNPCAGLRRWGADEPREYRPAPDELRGLWQQIDFAPLSNGMRLLIKLALLTGVRRRTLSGARKSELIGLDTDEPVWSIPKGEIVNNEKITRTKSGASQYLPLSRMAADLFTEACDISKSDEFVFPSPRKNSTLGHLDPHSASTAMRRTRIKLKLKDVRLHDARTVITTELGNMGVPPEVLDMILHHTDDTTRGRHYDRSNRERQLRCAMDLWANRLAEIVGGGGSKTNLYWSFGTERQTPQKIAAGDADNMIKQILTNPAMRDKLLVEMLAQK